LKKLLFLLLLLSAFSARSQTSVYHPFPDSNAVWCDYWWAHNASDLYYNNCVHYLTGELRQIESYQYNVVLEYCKIRQDRHNGWTFVPYDTLEVSDTLYLRQDTITKKVWYHDFGDNADKILCDFDLSVGDSLNTTLYNWNGEINTVITSIDSINILGQYRKRFNYGEICYWDSTDTSMVEGIGFLHGFRNEPGCFEYNAGLYYFEEDNIVLYSGGMPFYPFYVCDHFTLQIENAAKEKSLSIYPNPFHTTATLQLPYPVSQAELKLYNVLGEEVHSQIIRSQESEIRNKNFAPGIYYLFL
jgi:hypothetical protein